jgi:hypothetical protein
VKDSKFCGVQQDRNRVMSDKTQRIPVGDVGRVTIEAVKAQLVVRWVDSSEDILVTGGSVTFDRAGDVMFIRTDFPKQVSSDDAEIRISGFESPGQAVEEILMRTGILSSLGLGSPSGSKRVPLVIEIPRSIASTTIEVDLGNLEMRDPHGKVDCEVKRGNVISRGGVAELEISAGSGEVRLSDLRGSVAISGGSGNVTLTDVAAITSVRAGSGEVTLNRVHGDAIKVMAGSGDVTVRQGYAEAYSTDCGSGDVTLDGGRLERIAVRTGSGDVESTATFGPYSHTFMTGSGTVALGIPRDLSARIEAFTSSGDIDTELPLVSVGQRGPKSRRSRRQVGSVGSGEPRADVSVRTSSGDIRLHWLQAVATEPIPMPPPVPEVPVPPTPPTPPTVPGGPADAAPDVGTESPTPNDTEAILESLSRGEISVDEAEALLASFQTRRAQL